MQTWHTLHLLQAMQHLPARTMMTSCSTDRPSRNTTVLMWDDVKQVTMQSATMQCLIAFALCRCMMISFGQHLSKWCWCRCVSALRLTSGCITMLPS